MALIATKKNRIVNSPAYPYILEQYNKELKENGKVNKKDFYFRIIKPKIPSYSMSAWYQFIRRFETSVGLVAVQVDEALSSRQAGAITPAEEALGNTLLTNEAATNKGISSALNLGAEFFADLWKRYKEEPESLTKFEQSVLKDALFKAMKAQDSRIHAIGKVREDNREEEKLQRAFKGATYGK